MIRDIIKSADYSKPNSRLEIELLSCSARDYVESASASSHNLGDYKPLGVCARNLNYDACSALLKDEAAKLGAEVITDVKEIITIKSDDDIKGRFELFTSMRGTALIPLSKKNADENAPEAFSTL